MHDSAAATLEAVRPSRRTVTRAAAWTVPVIAVAAAAPAYAASHCNRRIGQVLDWDSSKVTFTRTSTSAKAVLDPDGTGPVPTLTLDVTAGYVGNMKAGSENNNTSQTMVRQAAVGGLGISGLGFMQATTSASPTNKKGEPLGYGDRGTYTFTFSRAVSNLIFTITDIDSTTADFRDALVISPGYVVDGQASGVEYTDLPNGNGNQTIPARWFQSTSANAPVDNSTGGNGNLRVKFAGPISTFSITYWNRQASFDQDVDTDQRIYVSDMTFDYTPC